jgi:hypothetical protein
VTSVNLATVNDFPMWTSSDGCLLYFGSSRHTGYGFKGYLAVRTK